MKQLLFILLTVLVSCKEEVPKDNHLLDATYFSKTHLYTDKFDSCQELFFRYNDSFNMAYKIKDVDRMKEMVNKERKITVYLDSYRWLLRKTINEYSDKQ